MKKSEDSSIKRQSMINFVISLTGITSFFTLIFLYVDILYDRFNLLLKDLDRISGVVSILGVCFALLNIKCNFGLPKWMRMSIVKVSIGLCLSIVIVPHLHDMMVVKLSVLSEKETNEIVNLENDIKSIGEGSVSDLKDIQEGEKTKQEEKDGMCRVDDDFDPDMEEDLLPPSASPRIDVEDKSTLISKSEELKMFQVLECDPDILQCSPVAEYKQSYKEYILYFLKSRKNTYSQVDDYQINRDTEFTNLVNEANKIQDDIKNNGENIDKVKKIIKLREKALKKYKTKSLCKLLADDYCELARFYISSDKWKNAYKAYINALEFLILYVETIQEDDKLYMCIYNMAVVYQHIGDIFTMNQAMRTDAYFLSVCLFEMASTHTYSNEDYNFYANYYGGMANHKLINLYKGMEGEERNNNIYILDAFNYYEKSLSFNYNEKRNYQYTYLVQVCKLAQDYIDKFGEKPNKLTKEKYKMKEEFYEKLITVP